MTWKIQTKVHLGNTYRILVTAIQYDGREEVITEGYLPSSLQTYLGIEPAFSFPIEAQRMEPKVLTFFESVRNLND